MAVSGPLRGVVATGLAAVMGAGVVGAAAAQGTDKATVIELTQIACQFVESENGVDRGFTTTRKADCERINTRTGAARLKEAKVLRLRPGKYTFRVTNKGVPYPLGFWLRERSYNRLNPLHRLTKISISGGGLDPGKTQDYTVDLKPGEYIYSCPLNTTPDYKLIVTN